MTRHAAPEASLDVAVRFLRRLLFAAMWGWIAVVTVRRAAALKAGGQALDGIEERRWIPWSHRDPPLVGLLTRARAELKPGEAVFLTCDADADPNFLMMMAEYALPGEAVVGARREGASSRGVLPTSIQRTAVGVHVRHRGEIATPDGGR